MVGEHPLCGTNPVYRTTFVGFFSMILITTIYTKDISFC